MPKGTRTRRIIPIQQAGRTDFRVIGGKLYLDRPEQSNGTKWASCEMKSDKAKEPTYGVIGITSQANPVYGQKTPDFTNFTSPCPMK